ncbi:hypothetical protein NEUTE1DRAFT_117817 [Neurospora tetrasperma FGSC 2508]|uniref:Uncharacterized protein n=1 Tax=Neurospora tetrasperma (strain FGSC 2508 / ATCC MYA-4615 / P0657) TaxID=510951 RepID=F8MU61_NEUT8|nr:uncharacterized protein NEUTE1DRAFT_117817 [Neurospora tetrasperma FGSC 2508]EGO55543.1 hypothetical protein NEUTE1DRAFT_117817 [Neurospora tetrasperma FGSC 2508]EGZ69214.1 hypothetical protein NEUTE2DRAFT_145475 [Neurospora tetrasperma FGSC 2509]
MCSKQIAHLPRVQPDIQVQWHSVPQVTGVQVAFSICTSRRDGKAVMKAPQAYTSVVKPSLTQPHMTVRK